MKFLSIFTGASLAVSGLAAPSLTRRACSATTNETSLAAAESIVSALQSTVATYVTDIETAHTTYLADGDAATAQASYTSSLTSLTDALTSSASEISDVTGLTSAEVQTIYADCLSLKKRGVGKRAIQKRDLESTLEEVIESLTTAVDDILSDLGLGDIGTALDALLAALGVVVLDLVPVVNDLLTVVEDLLDDILTGLGLGLTGISL